MINLNTEQLIQWFQKNKRDLPWRHTQDSYAIWVSEIMLQQTRVDTVIEYYNRFLNHLPTIKDLAQVDDVKLLKLWEGLGYYSRAKNMKTSANLIMNQFNGHFPNNYEDILLLKGIGVYSAGAILSRAFNLALASVDGNVLRVMTRYLEDDRDIRLETTKKFFKQEIEQLKVSNYGDLNESLMELGATICMPKNPKCKQCPLGDQCLAYQHNTINKFPVKTKKLVVKNLNYTCLFLVDEKNNYYFERKTSGVLKYMLSPILLEGILNEQEIKTYCKENQIKIVQIYPLTKQKHVFTHQKWNMMGYFIKISTHHLQQTNSYTKK